MNMSIRLKAGAGMLMAAALSLAVPANAQQYPDHVISGINPFSAGGAVDTISRVITPIMSQELGQTIILENKPGGAGNVGMGLVMHANSDGYTILFAGTAATQNPAIYHMPYDPIADVIPVALIGTSPYLIGVNTEKMPAKNLSDFLELIKQNPGKYNISGTGGSAMTIQNFLIPNHLDVSVLTYNGSGEAMVALMSGEVDFKIGEANDMRTAVASGKVKVLAVAGDTRTPAFPEVPTASEAGLPGYTDKGYVAVYVPAGTPEDVVAKLHDAIMTAVKSPAVVEQLTSLGYIPSTMTQPEFAKFYRDEVARWQEIAKEANIPMAD